MCTHDRRTLAASVGPWGITRTKYISTEIEDLRFLPDHVEPTLRKACVVCVAPFFVEHSQAVRPLVCASA